MNDEEKPKKSEKRQATMYLRARVTPEEKKNFLLWCNSKRLTMGEAIRERFRQEMSVKKEKRTKTGNRMRVVRIEEKQFAQIFSQVRQSGVNLNQIAKRLNMGETVSDEEITQVLRKHGEIYDKILEAWGIK